MPVSSSQAGGAPMEFRLAGKTFRVSPLRERDLAEFEQFLRARAIAVATDAFATVEGITEAHKKILLERAFDTAHRLTLASPEAVALMSSIEGASRLVWFSLRREHKDLTLEQVKEMLADPATADEAMGMVDVVNKLSDGPGGADDSKKNQPPPKSPPTGESSIGP